MYQDKKVHVTKLKALRKCMSLHMPDDGNTVADYRFTTFCPGSDDEHSMMVLCTAVVANAIMNNASQAGYDMCMNCMEYQETKSFLSSFSTKPKFI
jgi:hypothetical protein